MTLYCNIQRDRSMALGAIFSKPFSFTLQDTQASSHCRYVDYSLPRLFLCIPVKLKMADFFQRWKDLAILTVNWWTSGPFASVFTRDIRCPIQWSPRPTGYHWCVKNEEDDQLYSCLDDTPLEAVLHESVYPHLAVTLRTPLRPPYSNITDATWPCHHHFHIPWSIPLQTDGRPVGRNDLGINFYVA